MANNTDEKNKAQGVPEGTTEGQGTAPEGGAPAPNTGNDGKRSDGGKKAEKPKKVTYVLPKNILSDDKYHTVIFNGRAYQIECGKTVEIPLGVKEVLDNALAQREAADDLVDKLKA